MNHLQVVYGLMEMEDLKNYGFRIKNNGGKIPDSMIKKIFEVGITTKGEKGDGMGLAIVKELIKE